MPVKPRKYTSPLRLGQATATRERILATARRLFAARGYGAVRLADVAREADVSLPALYKTFGSKLELFRAAVVTAISDDVADGKVVEQPWFREQLMTKDARHQLRLIARNARAVAERAGTLLAAVRSAAAEDPAFVALLANVDQDRVERARLTAGSLASKARLLVPEGVAALTLSTLTSPELYVWMVEVHKLGAGEYEEWCGETLIAALLGGD